MKTFIKLSTVLTLLLVIFFPFNATTYAASKSSATVTSKTLNVREKPSIKSPKVGTVKKGAKVTVYSKTKSGWSQIQYKTKKAYVMTTYLKFTSKRTSYLLDKTKVYTYKGSEGTYKLIPTGKKYYGWDIWYYSSSTNKKETFIVRENSKGLYTGYIDSEYYTDIQYPVKVGQKWDVGYEGDGQERITSIKKMVKTAAGTFKDCIEVKDDFGYTRYYAKNVGPVKTIFKGKTLSELSRLTKK
ncbi:SH3 domain-containing protein [Neobacillus soli]|uniref:SH3 domain-containing protein n=1 Tax=Neobacillus soli TaxID=220688 RepID=UPI0008254359|nr:SH3 domain-containing protein [Neobacillus soli]